MLHWDWYCCTSACYPAWKQLLRRALVAQVQKELRDVEERAAQIGAATQDAMEEYQSLKAVRLACRV